MTFQQFKILLKVLETGNFTKTGEVLNISQSGVSHTINALENELGKKLLKREKGKIVLTEAGEQIVEHIREILYQEETILQKMQITKERKKIKIGTFPSMTRWLARHVLLEKKTEEWNVSLSIREGSYLDIEKWLKDGEVDIAITTKAISPAFPFHHLFYDPLILIVSKEHPLAFKKYSAMEEISSFPFIMPIAGCEQQIKQAFREKKMNVDVTMELKETHTILELVEAGIGISILPKLALDSREGVKSIPLVPKLQREVGISISNEKQGEMEISRLYHLLLSYD